jgi:hypothetical protein
MTAGAAPRLVAFALLLVALVALGFAIGSAVGG